MSELSDLFYSPGGAFTSQKQLYEEAKRRGIKATHIQVKEFIKNQIDTELRRPPRSINSFIPDHKNQQWHIDLADTPGEGYHMVVVDTFSKEMQWIFIPNKNFESIRDGLLKAIKIMGKPETLFSDRERGWIGIQWDFFIKGKGIVHLYAHSGHASMAERAIRTVKERLERLRGRGGTSKDIIQRIVSEYNKNHVHSTTGMTPEDASKEINKDIVREALEDQRKPYTPYPTLEVGDRVRTVIKLQPNDKKQVVRYSEDVYEITEKKYVDGLAHVYKVRGKWFIRGDLKEAKATQEPPERESTPRNRNTFEERQTLVAGRDKRKIIIKNK